MVAAPKRRTSPRLRTNKRKASEPEPKLAAAPAVTGAGDAIAEPAPVAKAPKIEEAAAPAAPATAAAAAPAGWFASIKILLAQFTGSVAATARTQAGKAKARRAARQAARAKRRDAIKQRIMRLRSRK